MEPLISIIIPVYNAEKYLRECIDSILNQTYSNIEVILVNDGSTDSSGKICDLYAERDLRVRVVHQLNGGVSNARNTGLMLSNGEWIAFVDNDDIVELDMLEELYRIACEEDSDLVVGGYYGYGIKEKVRWNEIPRGVRSITGKEALEGNESTIPWGMAWGKLYRAVLWEHEKFPENQLYEDSWTVPLVMYRANRVTTYPRAIYHYYERKESIMHSETLITDVIDRLKLYCHLAEFYKSIKLNAKFKEAMVNYIKIYNKHKSMKLEKKYFEIYKQYVRKCIFRYGTIKNRLRILKTIVFD